MAQGKKTSSEKIVAVVTAKIANPDLSTRDITEETGVSKSSVARVLEEELGQLGTNEKAKELYDFNLEIIRVGAEKLANSMGIFTPSDIREAKDYQSILDIAFKQNQLIQGKATEKITYSIETFEQAKEAMKDILK